MTAPVYVFICTKTTYDVVIPQADANLSRFMRRVHNGFSAISGGFLQAGDLKLRPTTRAFANHLLCDGSVLFIEDFPQLAELLGTTFGGDGITTFALPNYFDDVLAIPPLTVTQTVDPGSVGVDQEPTEPTAPGETGGTQGGNPPSGGRPRIVSDFET